MVHVRSQRTCPVLAEANFVAFTLAAKWRFVLFSFVDDSLLDLVIRCKDRDLTRIDAQDTVVAGLQAALIVTAFERLLERSRVSEWPFFCLSNCPENHTPYEVSFPRSVQQ